IPFQDLRSSHLLDEEPRADPARRDSPRPPCLPGRHVQRPRLSRNRNQHRARPLACSVSSRTDRGAERCCWTSQEKLERLASQPEPPARELLLAGRLRSLLGESIAG